MRKPLILAALLAVTLFGVGYIVGQVRGTTPSSAASTGPNQTQPADPPWMGNQSNPPWKNAGPRADGQVTAVNGDTITIKADSDQGQTNEYGNVTTVVLSNSTKYLADHNGSATTKASIKVGSFIVAEGTLSSDGKTVTASQVSVMADGGWPHNGSAPAFNAPSGFDQGPSA
jgi:hypothetical protein